MRNKRNVKNGSTLLIGIVLSVLTFWLFSNSLLNAAPKIQQDFDSSGSTINIAISITALFAGMFVVVAGNFSDKYGYVKMVYIGLALNIIGSLFVVIAPGVFILIIGRVIQGLSAAVIMPSTLSLIKAFFDEEKRQMALSYWSIGSWGGAGVASFLGGLVSSTVGCKWIFVISIVLSILSMLLIKGTPEAKASQYQHQKIDFVGTVIFIVMIFSLNFVITQSSQYGLLSFTILGAFGTFVIAGLLFILVEVKKQHPLIDFKLLANKGYTGATVSNFLMNAVAGTLIVGNSFAEEALGFNEFQSGALTITYLITVIVTIRIGEKILQHLGAKKPMVIGSILNMCGILCISFVFLPPVAYVVSCVIGYFLYGLGLGFYATPSMDTALENAPDEEVGMASGIYKMSSSLGNAFGVALSGSLYAIGKSISDAYLGATFGFYLNVGIALLTFILLQLLIPKATQMKQN